MAIAPDAEARSVLLPMAKDLKHSILKEAAEEVAGHIRRFIAAHG